MPDTVQPNLVVAFRQALEQMGVRPNTMPAPAPDRALMLEAVSRATNIVGLMLQGIEKERQTGTVAGAYIARAGRVLWAIVATAIPQSTARLLMRYWFSLLVLFEAVVILGAAVFSSASAQSFGIKLLVFTSGFRFCVELLWVIIRRKTLVAVVIAVFFAVAIPSLLAAVIIRITGIDSVRTLFAPIINHGLMAKGLACVGVLLMGWLLQWLFARPESKR
jgi:hypothetical protein